MENGCVLCPRYADVLNMHFRDKELKRVYTMPLKVKIQQFSMVLQPRHGGYFVKKNDNHYLAEFFNAVNNRAILSFEWKMVIL
jgi:hypothetical protein